MSPRAALLLLAILVLGAFAPVAADAPLAAPASDEPWARALVANLPRATFVNDRDGNGLFDDLDRAFASAAPGARLPVIVSFRADVPTEVGLAAARARVPLDEVRSFHIIPAFAAEMTVAHATRLGRMPEVRQLELNDPAQIELETATAVMGADAVVDEMGVTGEGIVIAVLDTGQDGAHADLGEGKIIHFWDASASEAAEPSDYDGHGTHVASIAAGLGRGDAAYRGVAPGASVVGIQIRDEDDAIAAYEHVVDQRDALGIRIATMSFGFGIATDGTTALERAVDAAWEAGIVCFKSNGNSGSGRSTMTVPAAARGILGIGSMLDPDGATAGIPLVGAPAAFLPAASGFSLSGFSSRGPTADGRIKPDLVAPGQAITAALNGSKTEYATFSGTSMASPFAAGSAALVLAADPTLTPDGVKRILVATAEDWGVVGPDVDYGNGRIRVREAVRMAFAERGIDARASTEPAVPFHEVRAGVVTPPAYMGTVEITDATHPIAATFIAEGTILRADILAPGEVVVGTLHASGPGRQQVVGFTAPEPGTYTFRVVAPPGTPFVVDFSHGLAPALPVDIRDLTSIVETLQAAGTDENATPGLALPAMIVALVAIAIARRR